MLRILSLLVRLVDNLADKPENPMYRPYSGYADDSKLALIDAPTPSEGCQKIYPKWWSERFAQVIQANPDLLIKGLQYPGTVQLEPMAQGICLPSQAYLRKRRSHVIPFLCQDHWRHQMPPERKQDPPVEKVFQDGFWGLHCPEGISEALFARGRGKVSYLWVGDHWICFCSPIIAKPVLVKGKESRCIEVESRGEGSQVVATTEDSAAEHKPVQKMFLQLKLRDSQHQNIVQQNTAAFLLEASSSSQQAMYQACVVNDEETDITLRVGVIQRTDDTVAE